MAKNNALGFDAPVLRDDVRCKSLFVRSLFKRRFGWHCFDDFYILYIFATCQKENKCLLNIYLSKKIFCTTKKAFSTFAPLDFPHHFLYPQKVFHFCTNHIYKLFWIFMKFVYKCIKMCIYMQKLSTYPHFLLKLSTLRHAKVVVWDMFSTKTDVNLCG